MKLFQKTLWTATTHEGSSLDQFDAVGGLTAGAIRLPGEAYAKAKGIRVWTTKSPYSPESHTTHNGFTTSIGGRHTAHSNGDIWVEFNTATSTSGTRGIYRIDGAFEKEHHWSEVLTKGEASQLIEPTKLDLYTWSGTQSLGEDVAFNMTSLIFGTPIAEGHTTMENDNMRVIPVSAKARAVFLTVDLSGEFTSDGPHPFRIEIRQADGTTVERVRPAYFLHNKLDKVTFEFMFYTHGVNDDFSTTGFRIYLVNESTSTFALKGLRLIANAIINPDFS